MSGHDLVARIWPWLAAASSGVALALGFAPWNQTWLVWIGLGPLLAALWFAPLTRKRPHLFRAALGYVAGLAFFWTAFSWIITVTLIGWFALAFYLALFFALWSWFVGLVGDAEFRRQLREPVFTHRAQETTLTFLKSRHNLHVALLCAAAWAGQEWLRGWLFSGFGWNGLGVVLHESLAMIQIADITGVTGLSFLIVFANVIAVITVRRIMAEVGRVKLRPHWDFSFTMVLVVGTFAYGVRAVRFSEKTTPLVVAAVQANIPQDQKWDEEFAQKIYRQYASLTLTAQAMQPQLLIWPEAATPAGIFDDAGTYQYVQDLAARSDADFLLGTLDSEPNGGTYNAAVLFKNRGQQREIYHKMHLVPFGEFIPFRHTFPLFAWIAGDLVPGDILPGKEPSVFTLSSGVKIAPLICFEDTIGRFVRQFSTKGAQVLITITNDGWFGKSAGSEQHLANSIFRAVENRRPLLRCANTGITCFIEPTGRLRQTLLGPDGTPFLQGILRGIVDVPTAPRATIYVRYGEWFPAACSLLALGFGVIVRFRK